MNQTVNPVYSSAGDESRRCVQRNQDPIFSPKPESVFEFMLMPVTTRPRRGSYKRKIGLLYSEVQ